VTDDYYLLALDDYWYRPFRNLCAAVGPLSIIVCSPFFETRIANAIHRQTSSSVVQPVMRPRPFVPLPETDQTLGQR